MKTTNDICMYVNKLFYGKTKEICCVQLRHQAKIIARTLLCGCIRGHAYYALLSIYED